MVVEVANREQTIRSLIPELRERKELHHHLQDRWRLRVESKDGQASYYDMARELAIKRGLIEW